MWRSSPATNRPPKSKSPRPPLSPRSTLTEVLLSNSFRGKDGDRAARKAEDPVIALNKDLGVIANFYPDVQIEVLRELLTRFDGDSRLQIATEQLCRYKSEWVKGRVQNPPRDLDEHLPKAALFRTKSYRTACCRTLSKEFTVLSKSAIEGVLAEVNHSYCKARPILQRIAAKTWRVALTNLFRRKRLSEEIPSCLLDRSQSAILPTGCEELDIELKTLFLDRPRTREDQGKLDLQLAVKINYEEAEEAEALFECSICYNDIPFEDIATCNEDCHVMCLECVRRSFNEAIFGQSWNTSIQSELGTLKCLAPISDGCNGHISSDILQRAILNEEAGPELWAKFEDRLTQNNLRQTHLALVGCPFCSYAEVEQTYNLLGARKIPWRVRKLRFEDAIYVILFCEFILPSLLFLSLLITCFQPNFISETFYASLIRIAQSLQTPRFHCLKPTCHRTSCRKCSKAWHDPHTCHEPLILSLRQSVEAARTAAVKRVCPRCGMSFVKASGCNKLTCTCGYSMCYLCRKNIGKTGGVGGGEGYRHFCEHFRPVPGSKCTECDKCDLYKEVDEDGIVQRAGEEAEKEWRIREGMVGVKGFEDAIDQATLSKSDNVWSKLARGRWSVQDFVDHCVSKVVIVDL